MTRSPARRAPWDFDPGAVARAEFDAWVAYYRRDWPGVLHAAVRMVGHGFGMGPIRTMHGAWLVLRANRAWAPYPDNDPDQARRLMRGFYELVVHSRGLDLDPVIAAELEVDWWHQHRILQHRRTDPDEGDETRLVDALSRLYSYVYARPADSLREAAELRVGAMRSSDAWVAAGCQPDDPRLREELADLERSYRSLRESVRAGSRRGTRPRLPRRCGVRVRVTTVRQ